MKTLVALHSWRLLKLCRLTSLKAAHLWTRLVDVNNSFTLGLRLISHEIKQNLNNAQERNKRINYLQQKIIPAEHFDR